MIRSVLANRLGNWLFQYAAGRSLALRHNVELQLDLFRFLDRRDWRARRVSAELQRFNLQCRFSRPYVQRLLNRGNRSASYPSSDVQIYTEPEAGFGDWFASVEPRATLAGYFQSYHYFSDVESQIRTDLTFREPLRGRASCEVAEKASQCESVAVHMRRGDYAALPAFDVCGEQYYRNAIETAKQRLSAPEFFVFSDDIDWCRRHFSGADLHFVSVPEASLSATQDLRLMSLCRHQIISNSTYSWWGAWLNPYAEKLVIAPDRWLNSPRGEIRHRDLVKPEWVQVAT